jgi:hypothetical protein
MEAIKGEVQSNVSRTREMGPPTGANKAKATRHAPILNALGIARVQETGDGQDGGAGSGRTRSVLLHVA